MARRTKRKSRSRRRKRGGTLSEEDKKHLGESVKHGLPSGDDEAGMMRAFKERLHRTHQNLKKKVEPVNTQMEKQVPLGEVGHQEGGPLDPTDLAGGAKRKKGRKSKRKSRKGKKTKKKTRKKRKLNKFFALMLAAKKKKLPSFKYNGKTYKGKKHHRLGMIYKKA